jgi:hypothetical protein
VIYECAWCETVMKKTTARPLNGVSSGICDTCCSAHFPEFRKEISNGNGVDHDQQRANGSF